MMTDQCVAGFEDSLNALFPRRVKAVSTVDLGKTQDITKDHTLIELGKKHRRILLTRDVRSIKRKKKPFQPCTHHGIVKAIGMPNDEELIDRMRKLLLSGPTYVRQIEGHFTHLRADGATIYKKDNQITEVPFK
jgi:hypothetical protein